MQGTAQGFPWLHLPDIFLEGQMQVLTQDLSQECVPIAAVWGTLSVPCCTAARTALLTLSELLKVEGPI